MLLSARSNTPIYLFVFGDYQVVKTSSFATHAKLIAAGLAAVVLSGCAQFGKSNDEAKAPEVAQATTICVLPNAQLKGEQRAQMVNAVAAGIKATGLNAEALDTEGTVQSCPICLGYAIVVKDKKLEGIQYQIYENGKPFISANGPAKDGQLQLQTVAEYTRTLMNHYIKVKTNPQAAAASSAETAQQ